MGLLRGVDIASFQGKKSKADILALKRKYGLDFMGFRCVRQTGGIDVDFDNDWNAAAGTGLVRIAYCFGNDAHSAHTQADLLIKTMKPQPGDLPCLDLEQSVLTQAGTNVWARSFGDRLRTHTRNPDIVYMGSGYAANHTGTGLARHFTHWWFPEYPGPSTWPTTFHPAITAAMKKNTGFTDGPALWQFYGTTLDRDVCRLTRAQLTGSTDPAPTPQEDEVAGYVSLGITKPIPYKAGKSFHVGFDHEFSDTGKQHAGPGAYPGILCNSKTADVWSADVSLAGLTGTWQLVKADSSKNFEEVGGYRPETDPSKVINGTLSGPEHLYLKINPTADGELTEASVRCLYWKRT